MRTPGSPELLQQRRLFAARMLHRGDEPQEVADALDVHVQTVRGWRRELDAGGFDAVLAKRHLGPTCRLGLEQKQQLLDLLAQPPTEYGFEQRHLWTTTLIAELVERTFGVKYHHACPERSRGDHLGVMLHGLGYSVQKPQTRPRERNQQAIDHWREVDWPRIAKRSRERAATVVFVDEAGFGMLPSVKKQWARKGQTPTLEHRTANHQRVSVIGGLAIRPARNSDPTTHLAFHPGKSIKAPDVGAFVRQLVKQIPGPLTIIWDNLGAHRSHLVKATLLDHPQLQVYRLPPYAPELNPIQGLWCHSKYHGLAQFTPKDLDEITDAAKRSIAQSSQASLLHACIRQTDLHHALYPSSAQ